MRQGRDLKLRNPIRGRKPIYHTSNMRNKRQFEIKKPHKGTETISGVSATVREVFEIKKPHKGTETL